MLGMLEAVTSYKKLLDVGDPRLSHWFLMGSPLPTLAILSLYLAFVKIIGPSWMTGRKAFRLREFMIFYNISIALLYLYILLESLTLVPERWKIFLCIEESRKYDKTYLKIAEIGWVFLILKIVELMDTVIFILRKKFGQISTLHVFHHTVMPIVTWYMLNCEAVDVSYVSGAINGSIHIWMYTYYGLSAMGPRVQKYLWWKKYLTAAQMIQFVIVSVSITVLKMRNCHISRSTFCIYIMFTLILFVMFSKFFWKTYVERGRKARR